MLTKRILDAALDKARLTDVLVAEDDHLVEGSFRRLVPAEYTRCHFH